MHVQKLAIWFGGDFQTMRCSRAKSSSFIHCKAAPSAVGIPYNETMWIQFTIVLVREDNIVIAVNGQACSVVKYKFVHGQLQWNWKPRAQCSRVFSLSHTVAVLHYRSLWGDNAVRHVLISIFPTPSDDGGIIVTCLSVFPQTAASIFVGKF